MTIEEMLDQLAEFKSQRALIDIQKQELINAVLTPEIRKAVGDIEAEFVLKSAAVDENISTLEEQIKTDTVQGGQSVKGAYLQAVYSKGRVSWDSKMLDGMIALVPQLEKARKVGEPSITIRAIGK